MGDFIYDELKRQEQKKQAERSLILLEAQLEKLENQHEELYQKLRPSCNDVHGMAELSRIGIAIDRKKIDIDKAKGELISADILPEDLDVLADKMIL